VRDVWGGQTGNKPGGKTLKKRGVEEITVRPPAHRPGETTCQKSPVEAIRTKNGPGDNHLKETGGEGVNPKPTLGKKNTARESPRLAEKPKSEHFCTSKTAAGKGSWEPLE